MSWESTQKKQPALGCHHLPRNDANIVYGVGISHKSGPLGWHEAESRARGSLATQIQVKIKYSRKAIQQRYNRYDETATIQESSIEIQDVRILERWVDVKGAKYVLVGTIFGCELLEEISE